MLNQVTTENYVFLIAILIILGSVDLTTLLISPADP